MTLSTESHDQPAPDIETDPYGYFNHMRNTAPVWRGTLMESDLMPEELKNPENWTLFDFESVFTAFREDTVFASEMCIRDSSRTAASSKSVALSLLF